VLPTGSHGREAAPRPDLPRAQPLRKRDLLRWHKEEYEARGEAAFTEQQPSENEALEAKIAELERFCGKLALENQILKKSL
jgi:transposase